MEKRNLTLDEAYQLAREDIITRDPASLTTAYSEHLGPLERAFKFLKEKSATTR
ncbi:hypothetical protein HY946_01060 [Candidatus Gottesmanbacteria bacterium]|nr:hypothetical protein [Candidatus Gottesmanbacteria bacterium]